MARWADWLFDPSGLTPHGFCLLWKPGLIWIHALADSTIGLSYFSIPLALAIMAQKRRDLVFRPVFWLFAAFILLCGTGHWLDLVTLWVPIYGIEGAEKALTAIVSVLTAVALWALLPQALSLPSPAQFRDANIALRASESRYRAAFEGSPVPLHTVDDSGILASVSDSWLKLLGYTREEVLGRPIQSLLDPDSDGSNPADWDNLRRNSAVNDVERRFVRKDGSIIEVMISARREPGTQDLYVATMVDITARRQAEEALSASEERLRQAQKMEAVGQLTGGIAHDFNNLLTGIVGSLELMRLRIEQGRIADLARYIDAADGAAKRAAALTHRLLAFSRRQTLNARRTAADQLIADMGDLIERSVGPAIAVAFTSEPGLWPVLCDQNQLESAILNLCINARDAMPEGGRLTITTANITLDPSQAHQRDMQDGDYVAICVADTGTGMAQDVIQRAFDPFFTTKPIGMGTGLGLSMVYGFAKQSGGQVHIFSELGLGTQMWLYLPRSLHDTPDIPPAEPQFPRTSQQGGTVLVVDDEPTVRMVVQDMLLGMGYQVIEAPDGPAGLRILRSPAIIDLLVTDVGLPGGMNGRQLADAARETRPELKVLFITGYAETSIMTGSALPPGMHVVTKPFATQTLATHIHDLLAGADVGAV